MHRWFSVTVILVLVVLATSGCLPIRSVTASDVRSNSCDSGGNCGVFMTLKNTGAQPDTLLGGKTAVAERTELHTMVKDDQGGMKMAMVADIPVPAQGSVELKPGSLHVMLFGLNKQLKEGDTFPLTLKLKNGGEMTVQVSVKAKN
jgi:copper(I)-binding protein